MNWALRSIGHSRYSIIAGFLMRLEQEMDLKGISRKELAKRLHTTPDDVSRILDGYLDDFTFEKAIEYAHALDLNVAIVGYDTQATDNLRGPINPSVFLKCWEVLRKPQDWFDLEMTEKD